MLLIYQEHEKVNNELFEHHSQTEAERNACCWENAEWIPAAALARCLKDAWTAIERAATAYMEALVREAERVKE